MVLLDGRATATAIESEIRSEVEGRLAAGGRRPHLAAVLVGDHPASRAYVTNKVKACARVGFDSTLIELPVDIRQGALLDEIEALNADPAIDGFIVQLPLPAHIAADDILLAIDPAKDVDGFHVVNAGLLATGGEALVPCTPRGCMILLRESGTLLAGAEAVVIGRSNIVGKPVAQLLLAADCTVTLAHSRSRDLPAICRRADIVVAAVGRPEMVRGGWIRPGATVIDVGINRIGTADGRHRLVGDVAFEEAAEVAGAITPVPGGVGPMTIACLLENTLAAARRRRGWKE
jgi:methylenetetrahydrofolate dehydrogenase (NADP+)/methenyltetrahydrofolate cyclohydrolase